MKTIVVFVIISTRTCTLQSHGFTVVWRRAGWWLSDSSMITVQRPEEEMAPSWSEKVTPLSQTSPSLSGTTSNVLISCPSQPNLGECVINSIIIGGRFFQRLWLKNMHLLQIRSKENVFCFLKKRLLWSEDYYISQPYLEEPCWPGIINVDIECDTVIPSQVFPSILLVHVLYNDKLVGCER